MQKNVPFETASRRIRNIFTPLRGYTSSVSPDGLPPSPQGEGFGAAMVWHAKLQFIFPGSAKIAVVKWRKTCYNVIIYSYM
ncbi:MAG: hypothetical protein UHS47_01365 [Oscillospiraceae bacterium]|nr:hypothetical protein [Oscillospiraceae bacterium]